MSHGPATAAPPPGSADEVIAECLEAEDRGEPVDRTEVVARYPAWTEELAAFFAARDRFDGLVAPLREIVPWPGPARPAVAPGGRVGGYEIVAEFARGGMGVIYTARQVQLGRVVALKMILTGPHAPAEDRRRFQLEAEAAARLDHPNIVPVYDVGEADGRPYYSMKLVAGRNLADHLGGRPLPPAEAARLVAAVARAVGYAHDRGVLHRDLKPANVLVEDGTGTPYVTDFGLARRMTEDPRLTPPGCALGTPAYLAPELLQPAADRHHAPTVAGDVYALGAILYECLTGRPPFRAGTPIETVLAVLRTTPPRPRAVAPGVPADLETVCLKCLDRESARRYPRAAELAEELDRWLRGEPVTARPVGGAARFARWCWRQPVVAGLAAGLAAAVLVGLAAFYREWQRAEEHARTAEENSRAAERNRQQAERHEANAEANFRLAHDAVSRFYGEFDDRYLKDIPGLKAARRELLKDARGYFERFVAQRGQDPGLRRELAAAHFRIAAIDQATGAIPDALAGYERALAAYEALAADHPDDPAVRRNLPRTLQRLALVRAALRKTDEARATWLRAQVLFEDLARAEPDDPEHLVDLAAVWQNLGSWYQGAGQVREAGRCYEAKVEVCLALLRRWPDHPEGPVLLARGFQNYAHVTAALGAPGAYVCWCQAGVAVLDAHLTHRPGHNPARAALARSLRDLASYYCSRKQPADALAALARARPLIDALRAADPDDTGPQLELAAHLRQLGHAKSIGGDVAGMASAYDRARQVAEPLAARQADVPEYQDELASCYFDLGTAHARQNHWEESVRAFRRAGEIRVRVCELDPGGAAPRARLGLTLRNLAGLYAQRDRRAEAAEIYGRAAAAYETAVRAAPGAAAHRRGLAATYAAWAKVETERGRLAAALAVAERRHDLWPDDPAELTAAAREFARIADRDPSALPPAEAAACGRAADAAVAALLAAAARGAPDYAAVRQEPVFARLRDRLPFRPPSSGK